MKKKCNNCISRECKIWDRTKDNKLKHPRDAQLAIFAEIHDMLDCHKGDNGRHFKFPDLVSKVRIENPDNPVISMLQ